MARERNCVICRINSTSYCVLHFIYTPYMQLASYIWFSLGDNNDFLTFAAIFVKNLSNKDSISEKKKKTKRKRERERVRRRMKGIYYVKTRENDEIKAIFFFFFLIVKARREVDEINIKIQSVYTHRILQVMLVTSTVYWSLINDVAELVCLTRHQLLSCISPC